MVHLENETGSSSSSSAVIWSFSGRLDLETPVISLEGNVLRAGRVGPPLKELPLVVAELEQVADDGVDLQREVTRLDVTETFIHPSFSFHSNFSNLNRSNLNLVVKLVWQRR